MRRILLLIAGALLVRATPAVGQTVESPTWTAVASTGAVDESSVGLYQFNAAGTASIKSGSNGTLQLRYAVTSIAFAGNSTGDCVKLRASLRDTGAGARVLIQLQRMDLDSYNVATIGQIDSDVQAGPPSTDYVVVKSSCLNIDPQYGFDPTQWAFYVDAQLTKTSASANPGLRWVQICRPESACEP